MCIRDRGIQVSNAQGYATEAVAELAVSMMITLLRNVVECNEVVRRQGCLLYTSRCV